MTARDLGEFIRSGTYTTGLECQGESLQELIDNRISGNYQSRAEYLGTIESLIDRLHTVEKHGYSPLEAIESDYRDGPETELQKGESGQQLVETNKTKKKKKKKKGQSQEKKDKNVLRAVTASTQEEGDPMVTTLLAMGFEEDKINAALEACGGSSRATVNDLVTSMLESSGSNDGENSSNMPGSEHTELREEDEDVTVTSVSSNPPKVVAIEQKQKKAFTQAKVDAAEVTKRQAEVKAAADRLASKREEQRRIRREWNNREQLRQKEEAKAKLAEEIDRRRQLEIEKAKRAAQERAAAIHLQNPILPSAVSSQDPQASNSGATLLFPTSQYQTSDPASANFASQYPQSDNNSTPKQPFNQPLLPPSSLPQSSGSHEFKTSSIAGYNDSDIGNVKSTPAEKRIRSTKKASKKTSPHLEVNVFEFPQLGRQKLTPPTTPKTSKSKSQDSPRNGNNSPNGKRSQKGKQKKKDSPSKSKNKVILHPTPHSHVGMPQASDILPTSYESNPLGEIRATAREFVPSFAVNQGNEISRLTPSLKQKSSKLPQSLPPGIPMTLSSNTENDISAQVLQPMSALLPSNTSSLKQQRTLTKSSILPSSSNVTASFERDSTSSPAVLSISSFAQERNTVRQSDIHSPSASATSSVTGLSGTVLEEAFSQHVNSGPVSFENSSVPISFENNGNDGINHVSALFDSNLPIGGAPTSLTGTMPMSSGLGILETNTNSLPGSNIWGGGTTSSAPSAFGFSSFNYGSENSNNLQSLRSNLDNSGSDKDDRNEVSHLNLNMNMWGGSSSANNGGGSIW